jgi:ferredoxin/flavodoxin---NADP+ reductase
VSAAHHENATLVSRERVSSSLYVLELKPDAPLMHRAGQFLELALPRPDASWLTRHYSIASAPGAPTLQLYLSAGEDDLTNVWPKPGERLWISPDVGGVLELAARQVEASTLALQPVMLATGTGIAPFLSMLRAGLGEGHTLTLIHGVRHGRDLTFASEIRSLMNSSGNYIPVTSQEAGPELSGHVQDALVPATFAKLTGQSLSPNTHALLLCGNPHMVRDIVTHYGPLGYTLLFDRTW